MTLDAQAWQQWKEKNLRELVCPNLPGIWPANWNRDMMAIPIGNYGRPQL